jgi:serine/threonine protein kinase
MIQLSGYRIVERLHSGAQFSLYRGIRLDDDTRVIIKVNDATDSGPQARARLEREFMLTRTLRDESLATAVAMESAGRHCALIFQDSGRISLADYLGGRSIPLSSTFRIARQIAQTLGRLHERDIFHKDVKPANILIDPRTLSTQLADFGIAAAHVRENPSGRAPEDIEGTLRYIAP